MKKIKLKNCNEYTIVDDDIFDNLSYLPWYKSRTGYVCRGTSIDKKHVTVYLHKEIIDVPLGLFGDHINRNRLDNRRSNLRIANRNQQSQNRTIVRNLIGYKGVSFHKPRNTYQSRITVNRITSTLGYFKTPEEAAIMYDMAALFYFGEYACTNEMLYNEGIIK